MSNRRNHRQTPKVHPAEEDVSEWQAKQWQDPEFVRAYEELKPEWDIAEQVLALRMQQKMTQAELAKRSGTKQPSIARLEKGKRVNDLGFVKRVAGALGSSVHVQLKRRVASAARKATVGAARSSAANHSRSSASARAARSKTAKRSSRRPK